MDTSKLTQKVRHAIRPKPCGAVILAAGRASRMGGVDKILAPLAGEPVIVRTVRAFQESDVIREIVIVTRPDMIVPVSDLCRRFDKVVAVVAGGDSRQQSAMTGMNALSKEYALVAVHDGARPLVTWQVIDRVVRAAHTYGAAIPAVPVKDTIKEVAGGIVKQTPDRSALRAIQTPQAFDFDLLRGALKKAELEDFTATDDSAAVEHMQMSVKVVEGDERNIKITTPVDLKIAELLLESEL